MKRIIPSVCLAFAFAVTVGAQSTGSGQATDQYGSQSQKSSSDKSDKTVSLTGCLQQGDTPGTFVLANVDASALSDMGGAHGSMPPSRPSESQERPSDPSSPPATGTSGMGSSSSDKDLKVELTGGGSVDLKQHVGHQVEVTGTMAAKSTAGTSGSGSAGTTGSTDPTSPSRAGSMGDKNVHKLSVRSVKMISSSCSME
jgi:hypothetical protein